MTDFTEPKIGVSIERKINLGNFENVTIYMSVDGVEPGATTEEITELLVTGDRAFDLLKDRMAKKIKDLKTARKNND